MICESINLNSFIFATFRNFRTLFHHFDTVGGKQVKGSFYLISLVPFELKLLFLSL
jgi:hypothetical protein